MTTFSALKLSRSILSKNENSLELWIAHARLERIRGRYDDACKIYDTVACSGLEVLHLATVWWDYAELEWLTQASPRALDIIHTAAGNRGATGDRKSTRLKSSHSGEARMPSSA